MRRARWVWQIPMALARFLRVLISLAFIALILFIGLGVWAYFRPDTPEPSVTIAPWVVKTSSRVYYAKQLKIEDGVPYVRGWWETDGRKYRYRDSEMAFPSSVYGAVKVIRRTE